MRSELVNYLSISDPAKTLLRACIEQINECGREIGTDKKHTVMLDWAYKESKLPFYKGGPAVDELIKLNLIEVWPHNDNTDLFYLQIQNIVKFIIACLEDHSVNLSNEKINNDYTYICEILNRIEGYEFKETGSQPVVSSSEIFDEH